MSEQKQQQIKDNIDEVGFLDKVDKFLKFRQSKFFWFSLFGLFFMSLLLFQVNISIGGDDSFYIIRAFKFYKYGKFPVYQGPLYPSTLVPLIAIFGINVPVLKLLSVLYAVLFLFFFYKSFEGRIGPTLMVITLLILAFNQEINYYASQTYNEMFHLFVQMIFFWQFFKLYDKIKDRDTIFEKDFKQWLVVGFCLFIMALSKNVGLVGVVSLLAFFVFGFRWKSMLAAVGSFAIFKVIFEMIKKFVFGIEEQISKQGDLLLYKDPYNFSKGREDFMGFVNRFIENSDIYLSKNFMRMLDLRGDKVTSMLEILTIAIYGLIIIGLIFAYKRNKYMFFTGIYLCVTLGVTFIVLQTRWDSNRLVFLALPFFVLFMVYTLQQISKQLKAKFVQPLFLIVMVVYIGTTFAERSSEIDLIKTKKNLNGDRYLGYTDDWVNFLKISVWAVENLPKDSYIACRKAAMSSIYTNGTEFYNISRIHSSDPDSLLDRLQENGVTHVIMAKLRRNPRQKSDYTINTIHRYLSQIEQKYRYTFNEIHQEGVKGYEEAVLFEVQYQVRDYQRAEERRKQAKALKSSE